MEQLGSGHKVQQPPSPSALFIAEKVTLCHPCLVQGVFCLYVTLLEPPHRPLAAVEPYNGTGPQEAKIHTVQLPCSNRKAFPCSIFYCAVLYLPAASGDFQDITANIQEKKTSGK